MHLLSLTMVEGSLLRSLSEATDFAWLVLSRAVSLSAVSQPDLSASHTLDGEGLPRVLYTSSFHSTAGSWYRLHRFMTHLWSKQGRKFTRTLLQVEKSGQAQQSESQSM